VISKDTFRKLLAFDTGKPIPLGKTLKLPRRAASDTLIIAFVRMGGESRPWGLAVGRPDKAPTIYTAPEARDRELVGEMLEKAAPALLEHMGHPKYSIRRSATTLPNVWLPNASHVEMLHFLAFTYTFAKRGDPARMSVLNALGRAANWLFHEAGCPGQMSCIDASSALRDAFTFPSEGVRQAHTGYLLAWLTTRGSFNARLQAASRAERLAVSTSLDPQVEKELKLDELVQEFNEFKRAGYKSGMARTTAAIREALEPELRRRFEIVVGAYQTLANDSRPINTGVEDLEEAARQRYGEYVEMEAALLRGEKPWIQSPETDGHSLIAASRYITLEANSHRHTNALIHTDSDLQDDLLSAGDGIRGRIVQIIDESVGRKTRAVWVIEQDAGRPLRIREGGIVLQAGYPKRKAELRRSDEAASGRRRFELLITAGIRAGEGILGRPPLEGSWKGKTVTFLSLEDPNFAIRKRGMLWDKSGPGTWLTHRQPWEDTAATAAEDDRDLDV
jgi:hypothetical protein